MVSRRCRAKPVLPEAGPNTAHIKAEPGMAHVKNEPVSEASRRRRRHSLVPRRRRHSSYLSPGQAGCQADKQKLTQGKVKKEPHLKRQSRHWDPIAHFVHQVAVVRQFIPAPEKWERFLGNLGTGILGVRSANKSTKVAVAGATVSPSDDSAHAEETVTSFIFLFLNAGAARLQEWNGRTMSGFEQALDRQQRVLKWESQRNDRTGRVISQIREHAAAGAEVVVAVRAAPGEDFTVLGRTREICHDTEARFLPENGDHLIGERGSKRIHRFITAQCLDAGLKAGLGLVPHQYPLSRRLEKPQFCSACCWKPATAKLSFSVLDEKAANILEASSRRELPLKTNMDPVQKRLRGKQSIKEETDTTLARDRAILASVPKLPTTFKAELELSVKKEASDAAKSVVIATPERPRRRCPWPVGVLASATDDDDPASASPIFDMQRSQHEQDHVGSDIWFCQVLPAPCDQEESQVPSLQVPALQFPAVRETSQRRELSAERRKLLARLAQVDSALEGIGSGSPASVQNTDEGAPEAASGGA